MTETIPNDLNPAWQPFSIDLDDLCHGDLDAKLKIECWDEDKLSSNDMIGWIETTVNSLLSEQPLVLNDRPGGKTARPGTLAVTSAHITAGRAYRQWQSRDFSHADPPKRDDEARRRFFLDRVAQQMDSHWRSKRLSAKR